MTYIERAIKDAVESGEYRPTEKWFRRVLIENNGFLLDPLFWQSLGKARGWTPTGGTGRSYHDEYNAGGYPSMYDWQIKWHRFIDHLAEGRTTESFFEEIYKT